MDIRERYVYIRIKPKHPCLFGFIPNLGFGSKKLSVSLCKSESIYNFVAQTARRPLLRREGGLSQRGVAVNLM